VTRQRTIRDAVSVTGTGLQTGVNATVTFAGAPPDTGIVFKRTDLPGQPFLKVQSLAPGGGAGPERRTTIGTGPLQVQTIEHLLAALSALAITNIVIGIDAVELPGLDGSAREYFGLLKRSGIVEQDADQRVLRLSGPVLCESPQGAFIAAFPSERFRVSYTLSYACPGIGTQYFDAVIDPGFFEKELAPARTFCLEEEALALIKAGLGKGANYGNTLVMGAAGPVKNALRFPDEPVRHKVLDLVGDLYLAGMPIMAHVVAVKSGHALNMELVKKLKERAV